MSSRKGALRWYEVEVRVHSTSAFGSKKVMHGQEEGERFIPVRIHLHEASLAETSQGTANSLADIYELADSLVRIGILQQRLPTVQAERRCDRFKDD